MTWLRRVRRFLGWLPIIWRDRNWDYWYLWPILERKFGLMEHHIRDHDFFVGASSTANELRQAKLLCRRLRENKYWDHPKYIQPGFDQEQQDIERLLVLMRRKLRTWWD